jgi:5,5'-dehydrodivanillate O-demethylase oxygenase subunit
VLTKEENELLTQVGPGTPGGALLRRYWQPVAMLPEISDETPTKFVRMLGEDLVLFRDKSGNVGLIQDHCAHRGASLLYGRVEERGISCAYHGWLYDTAGNCLETPAEPADSKFCLTVKMRAYPVREYAGLYWTYMGPEPGPVFPHVDIVESYPLTAVGVVPRIDCNWLQVVENNLDQAHVFILHQTSSGRTEPIADTTRGRIDTLESLDYREDAFGITRRQVLKNGYVEDDLLIFPNSQRLLNHVSVKVPIDDTHTRNFRVFVDVTGERDPAEPVHYYVESTAEAKAPADEVYPFARYSMEQLRFQDFMVLETQGPIASRESERLATSDKGVVLMRTILMREIEKVRDGVDPIGVIRDPERVVIDTHTETLFDERRARWVSPSGTRITPLGLTPTGSR